MSADVGVVALAAFRQVLSNPDVSPDDDFFELGGDSIQAIEALSIIEVDLGTEIPVALIFSYPTAAELAGEITATADQPS
jgi:nonribosomal peptide synthetase MxcG